MSTVAMKLRNRLEDCFNITIPKPVSRIHGVKGAAYRWTCMDSEGHEYTSEDTMSECVKADHLTKFRQNLPGFIWNVSAEKAKTAKP